MIIQKMLMMIVIAGMCLYGITLMFEMPIMALPTTLGFVFLISIVWDLIKIKKKEYDRYEEYDRYY